MLFPYAGTKQQLLTKAQCGCYILHANDFEKKKKCWGGGGWRGWRGYKQTLRHCECESCNQPPSLIRLQHLQCIMWGCEGRARSRGSVKHFNAPPSSSSAVLEKPFGNYDRSFSRMCRGDTTQRRCVISSWGFCSRDCTRRSNLQKWERLSEHPKQWPTSLQTDLMCFLMCSLNHCWRCICACLRVYCLSTTCSHNHTMGNYCKVENALILAWWHLSMAFNLP